VTTYVILRNLTIEHAHTGSNGPVLEITNRRAPFWWSHNYRCVAGSRGLYNSPR